MKMMRLGIALVAAGAMSLGSTYASDGGPLVDALVKKGVLSAQEGEEIRMDMQEAYMGTAGGGLQWGNSSVRGVKIYGDVRLRYQWENRDSFSQNNVAGNDRERGRFRYRLRAGADYQFTDNFKAGIRFSTGAAANSTNVTTASFLDNNDSLFVDLYYLTYSADDLFDSGIVDHIEVTAGKFKQPFMIDKAFWDGDINPEGAYAEVGWDDVGPVDLVLRGGVFHLDGEFRVQNGTGTDEAHDFLFAAQSEISTGGFTIAPSIWIATPGEADRTAQATSVLTTSRTGNTGFDDFGVFLLPAEYKFKAMGQSHALKATYGINFLASNNTTGNTTGAGFFGTNNQMFQAGYKMNSAKKKGTWEVGADYRYIEADAWSDTIVDSDFFSDSGTNVHGFVLGGKYAFTDFLIGGVKYYKSYNISSAGGAGITDTNDLVQVDLNWKF